MTTGRWVFTPMTRSRIGFKKTLRDRFMGWKIHREQRRDTPDIFRVTGY